MSVFAAAIDDLFADPEIARDALWRPGGTGSGVQVRVVARRPDRIGDFGETRIVVPAATFDVRVAEAPAIAEGDTLEVEGALYVVQGKPARDSERLVWTVDTRPA